MRPDARPDFADVRAELTVTLVLGAYPSVRARRSRSQFRVRQCPRCGEQSKREAIAIDATTGAWCHFGRERSAGGECSGDLVDLVAALEGLDARRDFALVRKRCEEIAGVDCSTTSDSDRAARRASRERQAEERLKLAELEERERRERALVIAGEHWRGLRRRHRAGEIYLKARGIDPEPLIERHLVRFESRGDVAVALHTADGRVISVVRRVLAPREGAPKVLTLAGCPSIGTMVHALPDIVHGRDVVLVEGLTDALCASLAWPNAVVLGANGAGRLPRIAAAAASRVKLAGVRLLLAPDDDEVGARAMIEAGTAAVNAGLVLHRNLRVVDCGADTDAKDLADAWQRGWRPTGDDQ